jgi:hypothetical protein
MADRPILFSAPMIRALLAGRKTQTRRLLKSQPSNGIHALRHLIRPFDAPAFYEYCWHSKFGARLESIKTPIHTGDRLWVKETWRTESRAYDDLAPSEMGGEETILYDADADWKLNKSVGKSRVSIHMTRWASRITLMVTDVRVERLEDISDEDAIAEGVEPERDGWKQYGTVTLGPDAVWATAEGAYHDLWDSINGVGAWDENPWVVAYTFTVHLGNIDQIGRAG